MLGDLTINLGWKGFEVTNEAMPSPPAAAPRAISSRTTGSSRMPVSPIDLNDRAEVFGGFTQATRAFVSSTTSGPFSTTQAGFDAIQHDAQARTIGHLRTRRCAYNDRHVQRRARRLSTSTSATACSVSPLAQASSATLPCCRMSARCGRRVSKRQAMSARPAASPCSPRTATTMRPIATMCSTSRASGLPRPRARPWSTRPSICCAANWLMTGTASSAGSAATI